MPNEARKNNASIGDELDEWFAPDPEVKIELESICRLHAISPEELSYKWESYQMTMGQERTKLDVPTVRAFKKELQESVEREARSKSHMRSVDKRGAYATPRNAAKGGDVFGMYGHTSHIYAIPTYCCQARWRDSNTRFRKQRQ